MKWKKPSAKRILVVIVLVVIVVFGGSGVYALLTPTLQLTASIAKASFQIGEPVNITITLQNIGLWPLRFTYYPPLLDFVVYDEADKEIFRCGDTALIDLWVTPITLWPTQTRTAILTWNQVEYREGDFDQVPKGTYTIVALTTVVYINRDFLLTAQPIMLTIE